MVAPAGFEPAIPWLRTRYPRPLDDGADELTGDSKQKTGGGRANGLRFASGSPLSCSNLAAGLGLEPRTS